MSNLNLIKNENYHSQVFTYFKNIYVKNINKKRFLTFEEVFNITVEELGIIEDQGHHIEELQLWFDNINQHAFINEMAKSEFEEMIFHHSNHVHLHLNETIIKMNHHLSFEDLFLSMQILTVRNQVEWNYNKPFASFHSCFNNIPCRVTLLYPSAHREINHFKIFIRKIGLNKIPLEAFTKEASLGLTLQDMIKNKKNILITGTTGSGKTALMSSLLSLIQETEHVIVLEDTQEILSPSPSFTYLLAKNHDEYSLKNYCEYALRMRPERIVIGELRGPEIIPFVLSMNNGHKGLISTIHANKAKDGLERAALLFEMNVKEKSLSFSDILKLTSRNIEYVIHIENKKIQEVIKVFSSDGERISYEYVYPIDGIKQSES